MRKEIADVRGVSPRQRVLQELRRQIATGVFKPGERLPTRAELQARHRTTPVTMQRVFHALAAEGLIVAEGRRGTFVSITPPYLNRYCIVFPYRDRPERPWPQFWRAIAAVAPALSREMGCRLDFAYGNETQQDLAAHRQLVEDVQAHRLAGLIFASNPFYLQGSPVLDVPEIPRVAISPNPAGRHVKSVDLGGGLFDRALEILLAQGRRDVAVVTVPQLQAEAHATLRRRGLDVPPYWIQASGTETPAGLRSAVHLLMAANPVRRPNGLLIMDDNLVPPATQGLLDARVRVPDEVLVVGHCNFPYATESLVPIKRLGYDIAAVLSACLAQVGVPRSPVAIPQRVMIPLMSEEEYALNREESPHASV